MASEQVMEVLVRRHVFDSYRPIASVLDGAFGGISQPDIGLLFSKLAASTSYEEFSSLVAQAQGSAGLIRVLQLDLDHVLTLDPQAQAQDRAGTAWSASSRKPGHHGRDDPPRGRRRVVAPVIILIEETREGGIRVAYETSPTRWPLTTMGLPRGRPGATPRYLTSCAR